MPNPTYPTTHGQSKTPTYGRWKGMRQRALALKGKNAKWYKNISICAGWDNFENFLQDMGQLPSPQHQLDRIDNSGGYWCGRCIECLNLNHSLNCRWATSKQQNRNRSNNRIITYQGISLPAAEWAERLNVPYKQFHRHLQHGLSVEQAVATLSP